jgi:plastocyanin
MRAQLFVTMLALGLVVSGCGRGNASSPTTPTPPSMPSQPGDGGAGAAVTIPIGTYAGGTFSPPALTVAAGTTLSWRNNDVTTHTSTSDTGLWSKVLSPGDSFSFTFGTPGTYQYHCMIHSFMHGTITVQ